MSATWNRAQEFGQPLTLIVIGVSKSGSRRSSSVPDRLGPALGLDHGQLAELDAGAGDGAAVELRSAGPTGRARRSPSTTVSAASARHVEHDQALLGGGADPAAADRLGQLGQRGERGAAGPAGLGGGADREPAVAPARSRRCGRGGPARLAGAGPSGSVALQVFLLQHLAELLGAPVGDQELQPGVVARAPVAVVAEDADTTPAQTSATSSGRTNTPEPLGEHRVGGQPAADPQVEARLRRRRRCTPTKATSLISWLTQCWAQPEIEVLNLRGRLENAGSPRYWSTVSRRAGPASSDALGRDPFQRAAEHHPRGVAARLGGADSPTASSCSQIVGTSSIRIQCSWTFCRSVMSATSRP